MKYKHKNRNRVAEKYGKYNYTIKDFKDNIVIPKELIEESNDRELIEEKDWIDVVSDDLCNKPDPADRETHFMQIREAIEKHLPKISEEELKSIQKEAPSRGDERDMVISLLKSKGLLAE